MIYYNVDELLDELMELEYELVGVNVLFNILEKVKHKRIEVRRKGDKQ